MKLAILPVTAFAQNCSLLWCVHTNEGAIVDPGGDIERIVAAIGQTGMTPTKILQTHAHIDHAGATAELARRLSLTIEGPHRDESFWIDQLPQQGRMFGFPPAERFTPDRWLDDGDRVTLGTHTLEVRHCPGHTPGHVVFFARDARLAIVGDVLFKGSIGRSDFPRGDHATLVRSIREKLFPLGDDVAFVPGHGPMSTFGEERLHNPFVCDAAVGADE